MVEYKGFEIVDNKVYLPAQGGHEPYLVGSDPRPRSFIDRFIAESEAGAIDELDNVRGSFRYFN